MSSCFGSSCCRRSTLPRREPYLIIAHRCAQELDALGAEAGGDHGGVQAGAEALWNRMTTELMRRSVEALDEWALWALAELDTP